MKEKFWKIAKIAWIILGFLSLFTFVFSYIYLHGMKNLGDLIMRVIFFYYSFAGLLIYLFISLVILIVWLIKKIRKKK